MWLHTVQLKLFKAVYHHHTNVYSFKKNTDKILNLKQFYFVYFQPHSQVFLISILLKSTSKTTRVSHAEAALLLHAREELLESMCYFWIKWGWGYSTVAVTNS